MRQDINRILFLGNSITWHTPAPEIGWHGDWGMAASSKEMDYVHILMRRISGIRPNALFRTQNIAEFERGFWEYDLNRMAEERGFAADLTILKIGENVDGKEAAARDFCTYYRKLLESIVPAGKAVLCVGGFWESPLNGVMEAAAAEYGCKYLEIGFLSREDANRAVGMFEHAGVAAHPSDRGMEAIAGLIWDELVQEGIL